MDYSKYNSGHVQKKKELFLQSCKRAKRERNTHEEGVNWDLVLTITACHRLFCPGRTEMNWEDRLLCWCGALVTVSRQRVKPGFVLSLCVCVCVCVCFRGCSKATLVP